jgi:hypothetical protein
MIKLLLCCGLIIPLAERGLDPRHFASEKFQPAWLFELAALLLETEMQTFLAQIALFGQQLVRGHF